MTRHRPHRRLHHPGLRHIHPARHALRPHRPHAIRIHAGTLTAKTHFVVPYAEWALKDPSVFILKEAKEVDTALGLTGKVPRQVSFLSLRFFSSALNFFPSVEGVPILRERVALKRFFSLGVVSE